MANPILPDVVETIQDGALGITSPNTNNTQVKIGVCSKGTANTLYSFTDLNTLVSTLGVGPAVEAAALALALGGGPVYVMPVNASVAGAAGSVTVTRAVGTPSTGTLATTGSVPSDAYNVVINVITGAATMAGGGAVLQISLDGGQTFLPSVALPTSGTYTIPGTGIILVFAYTTGQFLNAGDVFSFTCTAPSYATGDLTAALNALLALSQDWAWIHVVGPASNVAGFAAQIAQLDTFLASAASLNYRYGFAICECPVDTNTNIQTAVASTSSVRVIGCAGMEKVNSPLNGRFLVRSSAFSLAARLGAIDPSEDPAWFGRGPLKGVLALTGFTGGNDEFANGGVLDQARLATLRTFVGQPGFFVTNGRLIAPLGSDYTYVMNRRVMDIASKVARTAALQFLNSSVRTNANGTILDKDATRIEQTIASKLQNALTVPGFASAVSVSVGRTNTIVSDQTLFVTIRVRPLGYAKWIQINLGFSNPATALS